MPSTLSKPLGIRVPHAQLEQLEALAKRRGASRGAIATQALCRGLELLWAELAAVSLPDDGAPAEVDPIFKIFAQAVLHSARRCKTGRFGQDRLFINHAWRQYTKELYIKMSLEEFKHKLLEANRGRYLSLVCADMAPRLDQADVQQSEIRHLSATFHFLCV